MCSLKGFIYEKRLRTEVSKVFFEGGPFLIIEGIADIYVKKKKKKEEIKMKITLQ